MKNTKELVERIAILSEECGEVVQVCGKILRHGIDSTNPFTTQDNSELLHKEVGDILAAIELLIIKGDLDRECINDLAKFKLEKYLDPEFPFVHYQTGENDV